MLFNLVSAFSGMDHPEKEMLTSVEYEEKIMEFVDMKVGVDYKIYDVDLPQSKGHIHTLEAGFDNKVVLVLVHGYAAAAVFYFKVIKELKDYFHIYSIDLFGLGSSARPKIDNFNFDDIVSFFVEPLEEWRKVLKLENFCLMGHSMGGYICSQYYRIKNPPIKCLYLLSPAGFTNKTDEEMEEEKKKAGALRISFFIWAFGMFQSRFITPFSFTIFGAKNSISKYFSSPRLKLTKEQADVFTDYFVSTMQKSLSGEKALGVLLRFARYSTRPICEFLAEMDKTNRLLVPVRVMYGQTDWMDAAHSKEINEKLQLHLDIITIPDADHQIIYQNPEGVAQILKDDKKRGYENISKEFNSSRKK